MAFYLPTLGYGLAKTAISLLWVRGLSFVTLRLYTVIHGHVLLVHINFFKYSD